MKLSFCFGLLTVAAVNASAQFQIDWFAVGGGGGQSSGGGYALSGTIGHSALGLSSGGSFSLTAGFWQAGSPLTQDAPLLRIVESGRSVILAWPNSSAGFQLQETISLLSAKWTDVTASPSVVGNEYQVRQILAPGPRFFRLYKP